MKPRNTRLLVVALSLALSLALAASARAVDPTALPEGSFEPTLLQALKDGTVVRAEPGFLFKPVGELKRAEKISVNKREGDWLRLRGGGWVRIADVANAEEPLPSEASPILLRVLTEGLRHRSGPGVEHEVVGRSAAGDELSGIRLETGWWELSTGGWVAASMVEERGPAPGVAAGVEPSRTAPAERPAAQGQAVRRWSFMDLHATLFEIFEVDKKAQFLTGLRQAMRETGVLEDDWTYLRLVISVQPGQPDFHYSPDRKGNPVSVIALDRGESKRFGSVYVQGPVERIPMHLRGFFEGQIVAGGERFEGLLMFRPTLDPTQIESVQMLISGRVRTFLESP